MTTVSATDSTSQTELIVAEDGSIPAEQLAGLGIRPGTHLRVVAPRDQAGSASLAGSMADLPDVGWEAFERASELARHDASPA